MTDKKECAPETITLWKRLGGVEYITMPREHTASMGYVSPTVYTRKSTADEKASCGSAPEVVWVTPMDRDLWEGTFTDRGKLNADAVAFFLKSTADARYAKLQAKYDSLLAFQAGEVDEVMETARNDALEESDESAQKPLGQRMADKMVEVLAESGLVRNGPK